MLDIPSLKITLTKHNVLKFLKNISSIRVPKKSCHFTLFCLDTQRRYIGNKFWLKVTGYNRDQLPKTSTHRFRVHSPGQISHITQQHHGYLPRLPNKPEMVIYSTKHCLNNRNISGTTSERILFSGICSVLRQKPYFKIRVILILSL